jgi:curli production assembly/transport component CsgG
MNRGNRRFASIAYALAVILSLSTIGQSQRRSGESTGAQGGKPRIVVLATGSGNTMWTTNVTTATLEDAITQSGRFELITGAQRDKLLSEQGFNNSDLVDPKQATKVGKLLSARYIVIGNALDVTAAKKKVPKTGALGGLLNRGGVNSGDEISSDVRSKVQIQMIDAETGVVKISKSYEQTVSKGSLTKARNDDDTVREGYRKAMETIATQFAGEFGASVPTEGLVVLVRGGRVALDLGSEQVQVGQEFEVYSQDEPIKNAAGEVLSYVTTKYARLKIAQVEPKLSWATVIATYDENGKPDAQVKLDRIKVNYAARQVH